MHLVRVALVLPGLDRHRLLGRGRRRDCRGRPCAARYRPADEPLGLLQYAGEVLRTAEALGIDLVDVLRARWPGGEPAALRGNLESADRRAVARGPRDAGHDFFARELRLLHLLR